MQNAHASVREGVALHAATAAAATVAAAAHGSYTHAAPHTVEASSVGCNYKTSCHMKWVLTHHADAMQCAFLNSVKHCW
jgi:hypothetical protein